MGTVSNPPPVTKLSFTQCDHTTTFTPSNNATWEDFDLSAVIGTGIKSVEILAGGESGAGALDRIVGIRPNGSANTPTIELYKSVANEKEYYCLTVETDTSGIIECYSDFFANTEFILQGYWS